MDYNALFQELVAKYSPFLLLVAALIVVDLLTGVGSALKAGAFQWRKIADFYRAAVVPQLIGWAALSFLAEVASRLTLSAELSAAVGSLLGYGGIGVIVLSLVASIATNSAEIFGAPQLPKA